MGHIQTITTVKIQVLLALSLYSLQYLISKVVEVNKMEEGMVDESPTLVCSYMEYIPIWVLCLKEYAQIESSSGLGTMSMGADEGPRILHKYTL